MKCAVVVSNNAVYTGENISSGLKRFLQEWDLDKEKQLCLVSASEFYTLLHCYCCDISTPRNVTLNETNCDWLFDMSVKHP